MQASLADLAPRAEALAKREAEIQKQAAATATALAKAKEAEEKAKAMEKSVAAEVKGLKAEQKAVKAAQAEVEKAKVEVERLRVVQQERQEVLLAKEAEVKVRAACKKVHGDFTSSDHALEAGCMGRAWGATQQQGCVSCLQLLHRHCLSQRQPTHSPPPCSDPAHVPLQTCFSQ